MTYEDTGYEAPEAEYEAEAPTVDEDDCYETDYAFDIEEISELQDAFGLPMVQDGLNMRMDMNADALGWRPTAVEVLVMMPDWYFQYYDNSNALTVHIFDAGAPVNGERFTKTLPVRKSDLDWAPLTLPPGADWSGDDPNQVAAWLRFDFDDVIASGAFQGSDYFVAVAWDGLGFPMSVTPTLGSPAPRTGQTMAMANGSKTSGDDCSWPMFKIEVEQVSEDECSSNRTAAKPHTGCIRYTVTHRRASNAPLFLAPIPTEGIRYTGSKRNHSSDCTGDTQLRMCTTFWMDVPAPPNLASLPKNPGHRVTCNDLADYTQVFGRCYLLNNKPPVTTLRGWLRPMPLRRRRLVHTALWRAGDLEPSG